ncbi:hypothetical protein OIO90_001794 [Microbotryomycetes sp. JL221]|nr:hypothetical protein OIO90_001794 [Microbotryomycetes sp. JL221]
MSLTGESTLVKELTAKLEQLRAEKQSLVAVIENSTSADELRDQLLQLQRRQQQADDHDKRRRQRSASFGVMSVSGESSSGASTGSTRTSSFPSSPVITSPTTNTAAATSSSLGDQTGFDGSSSPAVAALHQENQELRAALEASELARSRATRDVQELKRRLGMISLDELQELDLTAPNTSSMLNQAVKSPPPSRLTTGSIRIPGAVASSLSPPSSYLNTNGSYYGRTGPNYRMSASYNSNNNNNTQWAAGASSLSSSLNTALTTPSSSYPQTAPPPTSPASYNSLGFPSYAFGGHNSNGTRAPPSSSVGSTSSFRSPSSIMSRLEHHHHQQQQQQQQQSFGDVRRRKASANGLGLTTDGFDEEEEQASQGDEEEGNEGDEDGTRTPLSTSPGSRSGSLSRRTSSSFTAGLPCNNGVMNVVINGR